MFKLIFKLPIRIKMYQKIQVPQIVVYSDF